MCSVGCYTCISKNMYYLVKIVKYLKLGPYELGALAIIALALVLRGVLIGLGWPLLDSDEGTMGLMAMHIVFRGEYPLFSMVRATWGQRKHILPQ